MANEQLNVGTVEYLIVNIADKIPTGTPLTDLTGTTPKFDVYLPTPPGTIKVTNRTVDNVVGMFCYCLIDTVTGGLWTAGVGYELYIRFTTAPEIPYVGPFSFDLKAAPQ